MSRINWFLYVVAATECNALPPWHVLHNYCAQNKFQHENIYMKFLSYMYFFINIRTSSVQSFSGWDKVNDKYKHAA